MVRLVEVRVHAGAPSARKDDDKYRVQAEAYLSFNGAVVARHHPSNGPAIILASVDPQQGGLANDDTTVVDWDPTTMVEETELAYNALESQLDTSSLTTLFHLPEESSRELEDGLPPAETIQPDGADERQLASSPPPNVPSQQPRAQISELDRAGHKHHLDEGPEQDDGQVGRPSILQSDQISQSSSYLQTPVLDRSTKRRRMNATAQHFYPQAPAALVVPLPEADRLGVAYVGERKHSADQPEPSRDDVPQVGLPQSDASQDQETTSELPTSYSLSDITSESSRARLRLSQRSNSDPGPSVSQTSSKASNGLKRTRSEPVNIERVPGTSILSRKVDAPAADLLARPADDLAQVIGDASGPKTTPPDGELLVTMQALSRRIQPLEPKVSIDNFTTHVTTHLRYLANDSVVADQYKPVSASREIRPLERGFWLVTCPISWQLQLQIEFWRFLDNFIGAGLAGWGVWCTREHIRADAVAAEDDQCRSFGDVKVYCWGEVVKHLYLVLLAASKAKARKLGLQWIDAEGMVVVQMRST